MSASEFRLTAHDAAAAAVGYDEVQSTGDCVWWLQSCPDQGGRVALMRTAGGATALEVTPPDADVRTSFHGYGGGAYAIDGGRVWYVDGRDGDLRLIDDRLGVRVAARRRGADEHFGDLSAAGGSLWCIRESASGDELVRVDTDGTVTVLARTDGFFGSPRLGPGGMAWLRWPADQMPWDGSELVMAPWDGSGLGNVEKVAGGRDVSITQPQWGDDGRLWFLSDRSGWWNLYVSDGIQTIEMTSLRADLAPPEWEAGYRSFVLLSNDRAILTEHVGFRQRLLMHDSVGSRPIPLEYTSFKPYLALRHGGIIAIASSAAQSPQLIEIDPGRPLARRTLAAAPAVVPMPALSLPERLVVAADDPRFIAALLYPPAGASGGWCAPLIVRAHPGPTSSISNRLDWHVQFLTGSGFAVVDVDYRGSSGYGRAFRRSLYHRWGSADVDDCVAIAQHLTKAGRTRADQVFITGASAGGYTALQAVSGRSIFAGAVARSAVVDPAQWEASAPRWQRPHAAALRGPAGAVDAKAISQPILLIHGSDDHIAPINDVTALAEGVAGHGVVAELIVLDAGHKLSAQQATARAMEAEVAFYRRILAG
jgi:dipeptidyl aminopeptidase/acylaminoacyl peptidase